jgi:nucleoid-associated protein YgaU
MGDGSPETKRKALLALLPIAVVGLLYVATRISSTQPEPAAVPAPAPPPEAQASALADAQPEAEAPAAADTAAEGTAPGFDVVRVEPDGSAAVVGTAEPGSKVTIYADEAPLAEAEADAQGNFVAIFKVEPSPEPRALTLGSVTPEGDAATSDDVVMLLPRAPTAPAPEAAPEAEVAAATPPPAPAREPEAAEAAAAAAAEPAAEAEPAPVSAPEPEVVATAIVRGDTVEVTPTAPADAGGARRVTLGTVSYAEAGEVTLAGAGTAGAVVRAYVDDRFAEEARVAADGRWSMRLGDVAEGIYQLRIDQLADDGKVASRVETPFQRDYPRPPPPRPGRAGPIVSVTVQPGHNLWTLARTHYGSGVRYTQIFTANRDQIRDPDLIYPGQIFNMPDAVE